MLLYWLWLTLINTLSRKQKLELLQHFTDIEALYQCKDYQSILNLTQEQNETLLDKDLGEAKKLQNICLRKGIDVLTVGSENYPDRLQNISDPPLVLFCKGLLPDFNTAPAIGTVGTRKATPYGLGVARKFGKELSECGSIVVSGGAAGIDTMALQGALDVGGQTVAVLGCGVDITYPVYNRRLFMQIQEKGCLLSEYLPGTKPKPWHFPERNRIISGLSNGVLVIEAPEKSGALITARDALEQGRDVYVVPANIDMPSCVGSNALLSDGAAAVFTGWDIVKVYEPQYPAAKRHSTGGAEPLTKVAQPVYFSEIDKKDIDNPANNSYSVKIDENIPLTPQEQKLLSLLGRTPIPTDDVLAQMDMPAGAALKIITKLSLEGLVVNHPGGMISARK